MSLHKAHGSTINIIGVITTAEAISPEYKSSVIKPEISKTYCTISPVLNLTLRKKKNIVHSYKPPRVKLLR